MVDRDESSPRSSLLAKKTGSTGPVRETSVDRRTPWFSLINETSCILKNSPALDSNEIQEESISYHAQSNM